MTNTLMDLMPIVLFLITIYNLKLFKPINEFNKNYLSRESTNSYRGLFALIILFHHISQRTQAGYIFTNFRNVGYLVVAIFFFYSGYGMQKQYILRGKNYKNNFINKRLVNIIIPYTVVTVLYWFVFALNGVVYSFKDILELLLSGFTLASFSWYIICMLIFYLIFYISMVVFKERYGLMLIFNFISILCYIFVCKLIGFGSWWYISVLSIMLGLLWAIYENKILLELKKHIILIPITVGILLLLFCMQEKIIEKFAFIDVSLLAIIKSTIFTLAIIMLTLKIEIKNKILDFLGTESFEIYMLQGISIAIFRGKFIYINNDFVWAIIVILFTILIAYIFRKFINLNKNIVKTFK